MGESGPGVVPQAGSTRRLTALVFTPAATRFPGKVENFDVWQSRDPGAGRCSLGVRLQPDPEARISPRRARRSDRVPGAPGRAFAAPQLPARQLAQLALGVLEQAEHRPPVRDDDPAGRGHRDRPGAAAPHDERDADRGLELCDLMADRRARVAEARWRRGRSSLPRPRRRAPAASGSAARATASARAAAASTASATSSSNELVGMRACSARSRASWIAHCRRKVSSMCGRAAHAP